MLSDAPYSYSKQQKQLIQLSCFCYNMVMQYVYTLISLADHRLYVGTTFDLRKRLERHNSGFVQATKNRLPLKLIHYESYSELSDAKRREKYLKGGKGHNELKVQIQDALIKNNYVHI
jgi:putative endonuclease